MRLYSYLALSLILIAVAIAPAAHAQVAAPVPNCSAQKNPSAAEAAKRDGLKYYRKSKANNEPPGGPDMSAALSFFEAACANGDDTALELRAYALSSLERFVDAAVTLDAFLAAHPLTSLAPDIQARVTAAQGELDKHVATLSVESVPPALAVSINHRAVGKTPLAGIRLLPGTFDLGVTPEHGDPTSRTVNLAAGRHVETFDFTPKKAAEPPPAATPAPAAPTHSLRPFFYASVVAGAVTLAGGVGMLAWSQERTGAYNARCTGSSPPGDCADLLSQYVLARNLGIVGLVAAGVFAAAAITFFVLEPKPAAAPADSIFGGLSCAVGAATVRCAVTF